MKQLHIPGFTIRPIKMEDATAWARYACLAEMNEYTSSRFVSVGDIEEVIRRVLANDPSSPIQFSLFPQGSDEMVASVGFHSISAINGTAEITYDVAPSYWGKGIATAACRAATQWGFEFKGWHRIQATTMLKNVRSQQVLARCGYQREGLVRNFRLVDDKPTDYWLYSAIPSDR